MNPILNIVRSIRCLFQSVKTIERYHQIYTFHSYIPDFYNFTPNCPFAVALPPPKTILSAKKNERHLRLNLTPLYIRIRASCYKYNDGGINSQREREREREWRIEWRIKRDGLTGGRIAQTKISLSRDKGRTINHHHRRISAGSSASGSRRKRGMIDLERVETRGG